VQSAPNVLVGGISGSKRVMAAHEQDQPARLTKLRTKELHSTEEDLQNTTTNALEDALTSANCPTQLGDQIQNCNEGKFLLSPKQCLHVQWPNLL